MNMCIFEDCGLDAIYCEGHAREVFAPSNVDQEKRERARELSDELLIMADDVDSEASGLTEDRWASLLREAAALLREAYDLTPAP